MNPPRRPWFQIHLSTAIVLQLTLLCVSAAEAERTPCDIPACIAQLGSDDVVQCMRAINALALEGPKAEAAIEKLFELADAHPKEYVKRNAIRALASIGNKSFDAVMKKLNEQTLESESDIDRKLSVGFTLAQ